MSEERPEKLTMREHWIERVISARQGRRVGKEPIYLTLAGAEGREIDLLVESEFLHLAESGAIDTADLGLVVAVESSPDAELELRNRYPGLTVLQENIGNILRSESLTAWPSGEHRHYCRAHCINLDLNSPLAATSESGQLRFPIVDWIRKFATLHAEPPRLDWSLFLTLHGEILWEAQDSEAAQRFLAENFSLEGEFASACRELFGEDLFGSIEGGDANLGELTRDQQQRVLMAFVPKKIAQVAHVDGWLIKTDLNLRYGGLGHRAPMVTWILRFLWDPRSGSEPNVVYRESLVEILASAGRIAEDGSVSS